MAALIPAAARDPANAGSGPVEPLCRLETSFSQGAEWKALIRRYIGTIPVSADASGAAEQTMSGRPPPRTAVSSAMTAKVGAAASDSQWAAPRGAALRLPQEASAVSLRVPIIVAAPVVR